MKSAAVMRMVFLGAMAIFIAAPLVVVAGVSFNSTGLMTLPTTHWSLRWYAEFLNDPSWMAAVTRSFTIALLAALVATSIALPIAYALWSRQSVLARWLSTLGAVPFMLPPVIVAIVFLLFWGAIKHVGRIENTVISHAMTFLALPLVLVSLGFQSVDQVLTEAARTMGANPRQIITSLVLPIILPFIVSSLIFVAILSLNEYLIAYMVAGFTVETLPVKVFSSMRTGFSPTMCVGAVLFMAVGLAGFLLIAWLGNLPKLLGGKL